MKVTKKLIKCKYCDTYAKGTLQYASHLEMHHKDMMPPGMSGSQMVYYTMTGKTHGKCVMCGKDTKWNETSMKYYRFCDNPKCKEEYRDVFKKRMLGRYNKVTLLNDPEWQRVMLSRRKISNEYIWSDRKHTSHYVGSYEKAALEFFDHVLNWDPEDFIAPSPHTFYYEYEGKKHFYIPDFFIPSLNCEIEIKDGGDNKNNHPKIQAVDKIKDKLKEDVMRSNLSLDYIKITNKNHYILFDYFERKREQLIDSVTPTHIVIIGK